MISCRRPSNRSRRLTGPSGPSKRYSFCTAIHGIRRRLAASASRARVSFFSSTSSCSRAASHSCGDTIGGVFIGPVLPQILVDDVEPAPRRRACAPSSPSLRLGQGLEREPVGPAPIVRCSTPVSSSRASAAVSGDGSRVTKRKGNGPALMVNHKISVHGVRRLVHAISWYGYCLTNSGRVSRSGAYSCPHLGRADQVVRP